MAEQKIVELMDEIERAPMPVMAERWDTKIRTFHVRLIRFDRPQSKMITIRSNSEGGARSRAQAQAGRDWRIARITAS